MSVDIAETTEIAEEITRVYEINDDQQRVSYINELQKDISNKCSAQENELSNMIHDLEKRVKQSKREATRPEPESEHHKRMDILQREKHELQNNIHQYQNQKQNLEQSIQQISAQYDELQNIDRQESESHSTAVPKLKRAEGLYYNISNITWDRSTSNIKGFITLSDKDQVVNFDYDLNDYSQFDITNSIWDLMEGPE